MQDYYFDTSIWLDFFEDRGKNGQETLKLIKKIIKNNFIIYYSEANIKELKHLGYSFDDIVRLFAPIKKVIRKIHIYEEEIEMAKRIAWKRDVPQRDALHAILAKNNELQLITRDKHFEKLKDITIARKPEEIV